MIHFSHQHNLHVIIMYFQSFFAFNLMHYCWLYSFITFFALDFFLCSDLLLRPSIWDYFSSSWRILFSISFSWGLLLVNSVRCPWAKNLSFLLIFEIKLSGYNILDQQLFPAQLRYSVFHFVAEKSAFGPTVALLKVVFYLCQFLRFFSILCDFTLISLRFIFSYFSFLRLSMLLETIYCFLPFWKILSYYFQPTFLTLFFLKLQLMYVRPSFFEI